MAKAKPPTLPKEPSGAPSKANKDSYFLGKNASHKLGAVKEMRNGYVYVPLEFLSDILNLKVIQDKQGQITISNSEN